MTPQREPLVGKQRPAVGCGSVLVAGWRGPNCLEIGEMPIRVLKGERLSASPPTVALYRFGHEWPLRR
jgi:hypothetical protein